MGDRKPSDFNFIPPSRKMQQDEQVQKLYEEMESQLKQEKERALNEVNEFTSPKPDFQRDVIDWHPM